MFTPYGLWSHPLDGVGRTVERIRSSGVRVAVVSNSDGSVRESLGRAGWLDLFEFVIDSHEVGVSKPDPAIFLATLERMGVDPREAWFVGDSMFHDVKGARAARFAEAVLVDPYRLGPDHVTRVAFGDRAEPLIGVGQLCLTRHTESRVSSTMSCQSCSVPGRKTYSSGPA